LFTPLFANINFSAALMSQKSRHPLSKTDLRAAANSKWGQALATKRVAMWLRAKQKSRMRLRPIQRTLANLTPVEPHAPYTGPRMYLCDRCQEPAPAVDVTCEHCNIVMHVGCLDEEERAGYEEVRKAIARKVSRNETTKHIHSLVLLLLLLLLLPPLTPRITLLFQEIMMKKLKPRHHTFAVDEKKVATEKSQIAAGTSFFYICDSCSNDMEADANYHATTRNRLWDLEHKRANAILIGRVLRGFLQRFRYKRYQRAVVKFQAMLR